MRAPPPLDPLHTPLVVVEPPGWHFFAGAALLCWLGCMLVDGARKDGVVVDEPCNIPIGWVYLHGGPYADSTHPPLVRYLYAAALMGLPLRFDPMDQSWRESCHVYGRNFLVSQTVPLSAVVFRARLVTIALTLLLGGLLFFAAAKRYGPSGAVIALTLFVACPDILAHGHLATLDVASTLAIFLASAALARYAEKPSLSRAAVAALAGSGALLVKAQGLTLVPIALVLVLVRARGGRLRALLRLCAVTVPTLCLLAFVLSGFRSGSIATDPQILASDQQADVISAFRGLEWLYRLRVPGYLVWKSMGYQLGRAMRPDLFSRAYHYLWGHYSLGGWHGYLAVTFLVKSTLPFLGMLLLAALRAVRALRARARPRWCTLALALSAATFFATCLVSTWNNGHRYVLPVYPWLIVLCGGVACSRSLPTRVLGWALAAAALLVAGRVHPHELGYLNRLAGPEEIAWTRLLNSSLEWGQDVPRLVAYQREHEIEPLMADLGTIGVSATDQGLLARPPPPGRHELSGWLAVTTTNLLVRSWTPSGGIVRYAWLSATPPFARIGTSIFLYCLRGGEVIAPLVGGKSPQCAALATPDETSAR